MYRFEYCNTNTCAEEMLSLGQTNMKMWQLFQWLKVHGKLRYGTQADIVKLYVNDELVAYSLFENYEYRTDKTRPHNGKLYRDLGVLHFVTQPLHRKKGYASLLADRMYQQIIKPLLARHKHLHPYIIATDRAVPLIQRTDINPIHLVTQFYSDLSFKEKVVDQLNLGVSYP